MRREFKFLKHYYDFFDSKLSDSSLVVWIIWLLILWVWYFWWQQNSYASSSLKSSIMESNVLDTQNIVMIWWKKYKLILQEIQE